MVMKMADRPRTPSPKRKIRMDILITVCYLIGSLAFLLGTSIHLWQLLREKPAVSAWEKVPRDSYYRCAGCGQVYGHLLGCQHA